MAIMPHDNQGPSRVIDRKRAMLREEATFSAVLPREEGEFELIQPLG